MEEPHSIGVLDEKERESILKRFRRKTLMEHLLGPFGSVLFHVLVIALAIKFMVFSSTEKAPEIEVMVVEPDAVDLEQFEKELEQIKPPEDMTDLVAPPDVTMDVEAPAPTEAPNPAQDQNMDMAELNVLNDSSPLVMKGLYAGRSASGRASALGQYGGRYAKVVEQSVIKALEWLKNHQDPDGSWGPNKPAMTGLGLLTFLAHGETTSSPEYGPTVEKAIRYLLKIQNDRGEFVNTVSQPGPYAHAIATYAISEAYGLTRIPDVKPAMEKAINVILEGQQSKGGWDYKYDKGARRDTSVAGWQIQALKSAYIAGSDNPRIHDALEKAVSDLISAQDPATGAFYYTDTGSHKSDNMTAIGVLCLELLGHSKDKECRMGLQALQGANCNWQDPPNFPLYGWYYITQAKFHAGGQTWDSWNNQFARELTKNQNEDGSWTSAGANLKGDVGGKEVGDGPVYATTFAALTLQVYYRFLPTYKPIAVEQEEENKEDVSIQII